MAAPDGFEPPTSRLFGGRSTSELRCYLLIVAEIRYSTPALYVAKRLSHPTAQSAVALWAVGCSRMLGKLLPPTIRGQRVIPLYIFFFSFSFNLVIIILKYFKHAQVYWSDFGRVDI